MVERGWHEDAVIYTLDVKTFNDSDGDGWGDFQGLIEKLDYIEDLGVTCLWLRPFYPSPLRDNGYDVADYYSVHDRMGTPADFRELTDRAHDRGIRVLTDLVFNHTSTDHGWFQRAREDPDSKYHDYYLWTSHVDDAYQTSNIFPDREDGVWSYDEVADKHYFHQFYHHQPDLNVSNPAVRDEIHDVMRFWLDQGADGFRIDAAHPMLLPKGHNGTTEGIGLFKELKRVVTAAKDHAVLIAEADDQPEHLDYYFGDGEAFDLMFNFVLNAHMVYGVGVRDAWPLHRANEVLPDISGAGQWANFLRNHDEWNLLKLPQEALEHAREYFGPGDGSSWIFGRGHRLRLADLFGHDHDRIAMAHSLLFAYPGTPVVLSGDEIGMGSDLWLDERESVRTPMQWDDSENGGFSTAGREDCYNPLVVGTEYSFEHINVADQQSDPDSLLSRIQHIIAARKRSPELSDGDLHLAESGHKDVLVHRVDTDDTAFIFAHNFADEYRESVLQWEVPDADTSKQLGDGGYHIEDDGVTFLLDPCDYVWLRGDKSDWD
ncbi:alpha-amylase family protein [Haloarcula sebkhae]|uniref:Maltose alpha-D-glucosyltransferase n=2 Tax=Haloarcula sebkhae TaxID=932660 RepID=A0A830EUG9_9EURY|nr:alpha-amylase family protein [Haloarcula sebkhae]GGK52767.1 maltose alpha-D-glucosyltransferase [Haloarcula sebkhae]